MANDDEKPRALPHQAAGAVAIILAFGLVVDLGIIVVAILWAASQRLGVNPDSGISENATQLLTGAFSGIITLLGSFLGYTLGRRDRQRTPPSDVDEPL